MMIPFPTQISLLQTMTSLNIQLNMNSSLISQLNLINMMNMMPQLPINQPNHYYKPEVDLQNLLIFEQLKLHQILENSLRNSIKPELHSEMLKLITETQEIKNNEEVKISIQKKSEEEFIIEKSSKSNCITIFEQKIKRSKKINKQSKTKRKAKKNLRLSQRLKNMIKNYGKKCAYFAISDEGINLINDQVNENEISLFKLFIKNRITGITNICSFRDMLLVKKDDTIEISKFKKAFQCVSEIFISNYATKWIFNSPRIRDVKGHLFARFKMLRRVRNPEYFTYIH